MIKYTDSDKSLQIPRNLGNYPQSSVTGGTTPEEVQRMIDASLEEYDDDVIDPLKETVSGKTTVEWEQLVTGGTKIATVTVDGTPTDVYAPTSGGGGVTPEQVQQQIDESLVDYPTSAVTQDLDERVTELENASVDYATTADTQALETAISGKSTVDWNQIVTGGTKVAEITIDGTKTDVYAPTSGGGGVTPQDVQDAIDSALTPYETAQQADAKYAEKPLTAVIYHNGSEDDPFTQADLAQLQALADALSGLTSGDTIPVAYIDLMDENGLYYRFILTYGEGENWAFIAPDTDGYTSCFTLITEDVSASSYYAGQGWDDAIAGYVENEVQPQIDTLTGNTADLQSQIDALTAQTADFETRISDLEALTGDTGNVVVLDINESSLYSKIDVAINDGKTVILKGPYDYEYQGEIVYLFYSDEPSAYRFRGVKAVASGQVNTFTVTVYENGTFDGTYVNNGTRYISVWGGVRNYTLPTASANALGGVKVGSGLTIDQNGVLSATGGGGASDYIVTGALSAITNPTEGQMATVEGGDVVKPLIEAYFTDYGSYDGSTFVSLYRSSDDGWMKDIWFDGSEFRDDINNYGNWSDYNWEGQDVRLRVIRDESDHSNDKVQIVNDGTVYMTPGSFVATGNTSFTEFQPALNYIRTGNKWLQYGKVYDWNDIKENTSAETATLVAEIKMLAKTGVPVWVRLDGQVTYHGGIECVLPYVTQSSEWIDFIGTGTQYGVGRYCHLYISDTVFDDNGFDSHGYRFDNNDIANIPSTSCVYIGPQGDFWGEHRSADVLYQEELQPYLAVKGCLSDFSEEYGFGSIVYASKWIGQNDDTHYKFCLIVPTPNGPMRGVWETDNLGDVSTYTLVFWQPEYNHWTGSQQAYNALGTYDSGTIYYIDQN